MIAELEEAALAGETTHLTDAAVQACEKLGFTIGYHQGIRGGDGRKRATEARALLLQALQRGLAQGQAMALESQIKKAQQAASAARSTP